MPHGHVITDYRRMRLIGDMDDCSVLDIGPITDPDKIDITPDDNLEPDARCGTDDNITDYRRIRHNQYGRIDPGSFSTMWKYQC